MARANRKTKVEAVVEQHEDLQAENLIETEATTEVEATEEAMRTPEDLISLYGNKSKAIRALAAQGKTRSEIAKLLGIRYQHVNNVLHQPLKRQIKAEREAAKAAKAAAEAGARAETETAE
jgi:DNA-directed RNA polymerase specialized sigma24 family protein